MDKNENTKTKNFNYNILSMNDKVIDIKIILMLVMMNHHIQQSKFISVEDTIYDKSKNLEQMKAIRK